MKRYLIGLSLGLAVLAVPATAAADRAPAGQAGVIGQTIEQQFAAHRPHQGASRVRIIGAGVCVLHHGRWGCDSREPRPAPGPSGPATIATH